MSLIVKNLSFAYRKNKWVLRNINLVIKDNCITGLFGPNGSGKSTLLRCLNGGLKPQIGSVSHNDERIDALPPGEIAKRIAVVPQQIPINRVLIKSFSEKNIKKTPMFSRTSFPKKVFFNNLLNGRLLCGNQN